MGLENKQRGSLTFVKITDGKFLKSKDESKELFEELTGKIVDFEIREEEYKGTPIKKFCVSVQDHDERFVLQIPFESAYMSSLVGFLKNADLTKQLTLEPYFKESEGKTEKRIFVNQNGYLKSAFPKSSGLVPEMKKVRVSGKDFWDKEAYLAFYENVILNELKPSLNKVVFKEPLDDLPF